MNHVDKDNNQFQDRTFILILNLKYMLVKHQMTDLQTNKSIFLVLLLIVVRTISLKTTILHRLRNPLIFDFFYKISKKNKYLSK